MRLAQKHPQKVVTGVTNHSRRKLMMGTVLRNRRTSSKITDSEAGSREPKAGSPPSTFHPSLQDQDCRHPIHRLPPLLDRQIRLAQQPVRFHGREPLIPQMHRQPKPLPQFLGEHLHLVRLNPLRPTHPQEADPPQSPARHTPESPAADVQSPAAWSSAAKFPAPGQ